MVCNNQLLQKNEQLIQSQASSIKNLEVQVGQLANDLRSRPAGMFPSNTEASYWDEKEQCKAIKLRGGKTLPKITIPCDPLEANEERSQPREVEASEENRNFIPMPSDRALSVIRPLPPFPG